MMPWQKTGLDQLTSAVTQYQLPSPTVKVFPPQLGRLPTQLNVFPPAVGSPFPAVKSLSPLSWVAFQGS